MLHPHTVLQKNTPLLLIILLGFAGRLYKLGQQSLWYDETVSAYLASQPALALIAHTARDIHPPGYYLLLRGWTLFSGNSEFSLAFFSLFWGVLLIALTYTLARHLINHTVGLVAALLIASSPYHIWYAQEVRMYTLGAMLGLIATYCLLRAFTVSPPWFWVGYVMATLLGLYALYYFAFLIIALNLFFLAYLLYPHRQLNLLLKLIVTNLLIAVLYLPWLPIAWRQATNPPVPPWRSPPTLAAIITESWTALALGQSADPTLLWPVLLLMLGLFIIGLWTISTRRAILLATYTFGPLLLIYLFSFITPLYHVRYVFTYSPAFYIIIGAGLVGLTQRTRQWLAVAAFIIIFGASFYSVYLFHFDPQYRADDYRTAVNFIQKRWQPGDVIISNAGYTYPAFIYYTTLPDIQRQRLTPYQPPEDPTRPLLLQTGTIAGPPQLGWGDPRSDFYAMSQADTVAALEQVAQHHPRLWLLRAYDTVTDPRAIIRTWLDENAITLEDQPVSGPSNIRAQGFALTPPEPVAEQSIPFEEGLVLQGWQLPNQPWQAGQTIPVQLWWTASQQPQVDYKMSLKLWQADGQLMAQGKDEWPVGTLYRSTAWAVGENIYHPTGLTLPTNIPPGQYWLNIELYHPATIQSLPRADNGETVVTLGPVMVVSGQ